MAFDGLLMAALRKELGALVGARVEKITQPQRDEVVLFLHLFDPASRRRDAVKLLLCVNPSFPRIHLTWQERENPVVAPGFCMLLRKHLAGARLSAVEGRGNDRVLCLVFEGHTEMNDATERRLYAEITGRVSNLVLTTHDRVILDCLHQTDLSAQRPLLPGLVYEMPPDQHRLSLEDACVSLPDVCTDERGDKLLSSSVEGLSPTVARELMYRATGTTDARMCDLDARQRQSLREEMAKVVSLLERGDFAPCVVRSEKPVEFSFMPLAQYEGFETERFETVSQAVEAFYAERASAENRRRASAETVKLLTTVIARLSRKVEAQRGELEECEGADRYRRYGDALTASLYAVKKGDETAHVTDWSADPPETVEVALDPRMTPAQNAQHYYKLYKKAQTAREVLQKRIPEALEEIHYLQTVLDAAERAQTAADLSEIRAELASQGYIKRSGTRRTAPVSSGPAKFTSSDGFTVLAGKNNLQNDELTLRTAEKTDVWFHVKSYAGSHVVVLTDGKTPPDRTLTEAATIAATMSSVADGTNVEVDYTDVRHVHKPSGAKPGRVIYDNYRTAVVSPDRDLCERLRKGK